LPATSTFNDSEHENNHGGGKVLISSNDSNVYIAVGDIGGREGQAQNVVDGDPLMKTRKETETKIKHLILPIDIMHTVYETALV
jgi:hypothetical protein